MAHDLRLAPNHVNYQGTVLRLPISWHFLDISWTSAGHAIELEPAV
jgi:hypothetical protein